MVTEIKKKLTCSKIGKQITFHQHLMSKITICLSIPPQTQEPSPCLCPNLISLWWLAGGYMQWWKLTASTGFAISKGDKLASIGGSRLGIHVFDCGFTQPSLIWMLSGEQIPCRICVIPGSMSRHSISSPNVASAGATASTTVCGWTTAGTLNLDVTECLSHSWRESAASSYPGCVNSSSFICYWRNLSMHCCNILLILPITQPGSSS